VAFLLAAEDESAQTARGCCAERDGTVVGLERDLAGCCCYDMGRQDIGLVKPRNAVRDNSRSGSGPANWGPEDAASTRRPHPPARAATRHGRGRRREGPRHSRRGRQQQEVRRQEAPAAAVLHGPRVRVATAAAARQR